MDISHILARIFGVVFIVMYGGMILNHRYYREVYGQIIQQPIILFLSGFIGLVLGVVTLEIHPIWVFDWRLIITLIGALMTLQGIIRIFFPKQVLSLAKGLLKEENYNILIYLFGSFFILGLYLLYLSF